MGLSLGTLQVLLVEPSSMQAKAIENVLTRSGIGQVAVIESAATALAAMRAHAPSVVISSMYWPDMTEG